MQYNNIVTGIFRERPNRFIALVEINGQLEKCHVKNTGRCREILTPGAEVYLQDALAGDNLMINANQVAKNGTENAEQEQAEKDGTVKAEQEQTAKIGNGGLRVKRGAASARKTRYDVIAVKKGSRIVNMDSQVPNKAVAQWLAEGNLFSKNAIIRPEQKYGNSRFDLYIEDGGRKAFMEIKGVTLEEDGIARFPDAPTERGVKHVLELCQCAQEGYEAYIFFLIQMKGVRQLEPNWKTHEAFGIALQEAQKCGVKILAYDSVVTEDSIYVGAQIPVKL